MKFLATSIFVCFFLISNSQTLLRPTAEREHSKQDTISALKDMAFCSCLINGFPGDSLDAKDPSIFVLLDTKGISFDILDSINVFTSNFISSLPTTLPGQNKESTSKKRIMTGCINMYKSKSLDSFVKSLYSNHRELFTKMPS